jgi:hypothetical protein
MVLEKGFTLNKGVANMSHAERKAGEPLFVMKQKIGGGGG